MQFRAESPEAEELARWLWGLTQRLSIRELAERFEYNKTKWAQFRNGSQLIPNWLLDKVVSELVPEPALQHRMLRRGRELLARAERAAAGSPTTAMRRLSEQELQARLEQARRGQADAQRTLMGMTQLTVLLLGITASLTVRCQELEEDNASEQQQHHFRRLLGRAEAQLEQARQGREEAEELRLEAHLQAERYRRALGGPLLPATVTASLGDLSLPQEEQECDRLLATSAQYLLEARQALDSLRTVLGLPPRSEYAAIRIVRGQLVDQDEHYRDGTRGAVHQPDTGAAQENQLWRGWRWKPRRAWVASAVAGALLPAAAWWLYSAVVKAVVDEFGRRPDPRSGDVHEFGRHGGPCQGSIGMLLVKGAGHAADVEGRAVRGDPA